ncbi:hypothetical protein E3N88_38286 [Mikania micrantha]|uniref:Uncharacterized protein n=1 Tax=Mikania micrantha TaxID=192012 RepID=A0A5N6LTM5_9ASTR|nr:hypothetical protein E3N88_38286 [Mikania micrantha]
MFHARLSGRTQAGQQEGLKEENCARNGERGRKPCAKRSPGLSGNEKRRKISKYGISGLVAVRDGEVEGSRRYAMVEKYLISPDFFAVREALFCFLSRYATGEAAGKWD